MRVSLTQQVANTEPPAAALDHRAGRRRLLRSPRARSLLADAGGLAIGIGGLLGIWYLMTLHTARILLPLPQDVARDALSWWSSDPELAAYGIAQTGYAGNMLYTMENVLVAVVIGTVLGSLIGLVSARAELFRAVLNPIVVTAATIPVLVTAPFFLIWFGIGRAGGLVLVTFYTTVTIIIFAQRAATNLDPVYESNARTCGAGPRRLLLDVVVPGTLPEIIGGLRIAVAAAWGLETVAELLGAGRGMGEVITIVAGQFDTAGLMAAVLYIAIGALILDGLVVLASKQILKWRLT